MREGPCRAHLRRDFHDVWKATDSPIAREALERIGALHNVEAAVNGKPRDIRHAMRQKQSRPKVEAFREWCERQLTLIPGKGDLAKAMRYALTRWASFTLFLDDGRVAIDNNPAERALKAVVLLWLPPVMQESLNLLACDRLRSSFRPLCAAYLEAAGRYGDLRIGSKSCRRAYKLEEPHWFPRSRSVRSLRPFRSSLSHISRDTDTG